MQQDESRCNTVAGAGLPVNIINTQAMNPAPPCHWALTVHHTLNPVLLRIAATLGMEKLELGYIGSTSSGS
jgi:hypothetical protein